MTSLSAVDVLAEATRGAVVVDTRVPSDFAAEHVPGAVNVAYAAGEMHRRLATVVPPGHRLVVVGPTDGLLRTVVEELSTALDYSLLGYLAGGVEAWHAEGFPTARVGQLTLEAVLGRLQADELLLLDVREQAAWNREHIPRSRSLPLHRVWATAGSFREDQSLACIDEDPWRSSAAASVLLRAGLRRVADVPEGLLGWRRAGYDLHHPSVPPLP